MASVRKRKWIHNGAEREAWILDYVDQAGKRRQKTFQKKKVADKGRQKIKAEIEGGTHVHSRDAVTFAEAVEAYIGDIERRNHIGDKMTGSTFYTKRGLCRNHLIPQLGGKLLTGLDRGCLQDIINGLANKLQKSTVAGFASEIMLILTFAVRRKWLKVHPLASEPLHVPGRSIKRKIPSKGEIEQILRALADRYYNESPQRASSSRGVCDPRHIHRNATW
jgi:integrase